jgi:hypothetical protein
MLGQDDPAQQTAAHVTEAARSSRRGRKPNQAQPAGQAALAGAELAASAQGGPQHTKTAAEWDRATDRVTFDRPAIEQVAAHDGPNQGMAKLLIAARAEGANSRWPF